MINRVLVKKLGPLNMSFPFMLLTLISNLVFFLFDFLGLTCAIYLANFTVNYPNAMALVMDAYSHKN